MSREEEWEGRYRRGETGWDRNGSNPLLHSWLVNELSPGSRVLIPGCGHGYEVIELARLGFDVTGLDIAPTPVARLQRDIDAEGLSAHAQVVQADMFDYRPEKPFDAVYEQTSLCAIEPDQRQAYERQLYSWLKPGGSIFALFMQTDKEGGPPYHCDIVAMHELFAAARWQWRNSEAAQHSPHPSGRFELGHRLIKI